MPITDTACIILTTAAQHPNHAAELPERLPAAAQRAVVKSMLKSGLLEEVAAGDNQTVWRTAEDGQRLTLRATRAGLNEVSTSAAESVIIGAPDRFETTRLQLRAAAQAVLAKWDSVDQVGLVDAVAALRSSLTAGRRVAQLSRIPREGTKRVSVLGLLRRTEGATVVQIAETTGWAKHTVHGFLAGLKKAGTPIEVLDRVRQVGAGQGSKGSYSVYGIKETL